MYNYPKNVSLPAVVSSESSSSLLSASSSSLRSRRSFSALVRAARSASRSSCASASADSASRAAFCAAARAALSSSARLIADASSSSRFAVRVLVSQWCVLWLFWVEVLKNDSKLKILEIGFYLVKYFKTIKYDVLTYGHLNTSPMWWKIFAKV